MTKTEFAATPHPVDGDPPDSAVPSSVEPVLFPDDGSTTFAILDAAKVTGLAEMLATSGLAHDSLFNGQARDDFADAGPWIVQLEPGNVLVKHLFTSDRKGDLPWGLWERNPGIFLRARSDLDTLKAHFRHFTKVRDDQGKWIYFRFYEDWVLRCYLDGMAQMPDRLTDLMATRGGDWISFISRTASYEATPALRNSGTARRPTIIDDPVRAAFVAGRWDRFLTRLIAALRSDDDMPVDVNDHDVRSVAKVAFDRGYRGERSLHNIVRAWILLQGTHHKLQQIEHDVDPAKRLTAAQRSRLIFKSAKTKSDQLGVEYV